ncbi:putative Clr5 domain-containing protein [Septoria linicola]|nr:putative Clr5 domain-containing protein [Septoria linicola]
MNNVVVDSTKKRVGRPPKYDWTDKKDICHQLYVVEHKSASEVQKYFSQHFNLPINDLPCRKGFLRQFAAWGFPNHIKKLSDEEVAAASGRIQELWNQNMNQKDIKGTIASEGYEIKDYDFGKIWRKLGLRLRNESGYKAPDPEKKKRKRSDGAAQAAPVEQQDLQTQLEIAAAMPALEVDPEEGQPLSAPLNPEQEALRQQRILEIQLESDQKLATNKRRRRIRGFGHLPPDAPGLAPRYNSETSLDECKAILHLGNEMYQTVRKDFQTVCENMNIIKKSKCAEGFWEEAKRTLIGENMHLSAMMHPLQPDQDRKIIALDCLCQDVTKRMRDAGKQITIADANNIIGINPTESKAVRRSLYELLAATHFESRLLSGEDHYQSLKQQWLDANSDKLQEAVNTQDPRKVKAVELLCSDAMKRFREDKTRRGERQVIQRNTNYGPGPGPAWAATAPRSKAGVEARALREAGQPVPKPKQHGDLPNRFPPHISDPLSTLAQPADSPPLNLDPALSATVGPFVIEQPPQSIPAWFRLSPNSSLATAHPKLWHGKLLTATMKDLHSAATSKADIAVVTKISGLVKSDDGGDDSWQIDLDDELEVYLEAAGEKPTFVVVLDDGKGNGQA